MSLIKGGVSAADNAQSGVSNSGNQNVNYAAPTHPAFTDVFPATTGAAALAGSLGSPVVIAVALGLLVAAWALTRSKNHGQ